MSSIRYTTARTDDDVDQIYALQAANLVSRVSAATQASEGFVTVRHEPEVLRRMNAAAPAVIARADAQVVGYALVMPRSFAVDVPILAPLFAVLDTLTWRGRALRDDPRWFVMGQICVAAEYRGLGVVQGLYAAMAAAYGERFDYTVTKCTLAARPRTGRLRDPPRLCGCTDRRAMARGGLGPDAREMSGGTSTARETRSG